MLSKSFDRFGRTSNATWFINQNFISNFDYTYDNIDNVVQIDMNHLKQFAADPTGTRANITLDAVDRMTAAMNLDFSARFFIVNKVGDYIVNYAWNKIASIFDL